MKTLLIVYHERLGDIARCLPIAWHFSQLGHTVCFECNGEYHGLFDFVWYATPITPGHGMTFDRTLDLQIWPTRFDDFTKSGKNWSDFVYGLIPEGKEINRQIHMNPTEASHIVTPEWLEHACIVFPNGYSQSNPPQPVLVPIQAQRMFPGVPICVLGKKDLGYYELPDIPTLVRWIWLAGYVLTVNTAASILASAVRQSWHHIPDLDPQHDFVHPNQIRVGRLG